MRLKRYIVEIKAREKEIIQKYKDVPVEKIPVEDLWIAMMSGNKKLSKNIKTFNLPAGKSCPNAKLCYKDCYAKKAEYMRLSVLPSRMRNFRLAKEAPLLLKTKILAHLKKGDIVRIHESGDFFSQEYIDMWEEIVKERPDVLFYSYTKTMKMFNFSKIKALPNFNIVDSLFGDKVNFGPEDEITIRAQELGLPICPCGPKNTTRCGIDCTICMQKGNEGVLFVKH